MANPPEENGRYAQGKLEAQMDVLLQAVGRLDGRVDGLDRRLEMVVAHEVRITEIEEQQTAIWRWKDSLFSRGVGLVTVCLFAAGIVAGAVAYVATH